MPASATLCLQRLGRVRKESACCRTKENRRRRRATSNPSAKCGGSLVCVCVRVLTKLHTTAQFACNLIILCPLCNPHGDIFREYMFGWKCACIQPQLLPTLPQLSAGTPLPRQTLTITLSFCPDNNMGPKRGRVWTSLSPSNT